MFGVKVPPLASYHVSPGLKWPPKTAPGSRACGLSFNQSPRSRITIRLPEGAKAAASVAPPMPEPMIRTSGYVMRALPLLRDHWPKPDPPRRQGFDPPASAGDKDDSPTAHRVITANVSELPCGVIPNRRGRGKEIENFGCEGRLLPQTHGKIRRNRGKFRKIYRLNHGDAARSGRMRSRM